MLTDELILPMAASIGFIKVFIGMLVRISPSTVGARLLSSLAQSAALIITGLMAHELGGKRWAVILGSLVAWITPFSFIQGALFQYDNIYNEESKVTDIFFYRGMRETWEDFWQHIHHFG